MRKIREMLRLRSQGLSHREIATSCSVGYGTVGELLRRFVKLGLSFDSVQDLDDEALEKLIYPPPPSRSEKEKAIPDFGQVFLELKRAGVTLQLLWEEYRQANPRGYGYSWFCSEFRAFTRKKNVFLRQHYKAGEQMQVDWAGQTFPIRDRETGETTEAKLFVACLSASQLIYAELFRGQTLEEWIQGHVRALEYFGGAPEILIPDNTKTAITSPCRYEPEENPTYAEMAQHYGMAVIPARVRKPRDKAKVENGVQQVERWILAKLRNVTFFSVADGNRTVLELLDELNNRERSDLGLSRRELFEKIERAALRPLPAERFHPYEQKKVRVGPDYHVEFDRHYYSVPYQLVSQELNLKATAQIVELFSRAKSVARHPRSYKPGHTTIAEHMPKAHQEYRGWSPERLVRWAQKSGEAASSVVEQILRSRSHPQQGYRACLGLMDLGTKYGNIRLEAACAYAMKIQNPTYRSVKSILEKGLDQQPPPPEGPTLSSQLVHANVRGAGYYSGGQES